MHLAYKRYHVFISTLCMSQDCSTGQAFDMYAKFLGRQVAVSLATDMLHAPMQSWQHASASEALGH